MPQAFIALTDTSYIEAFWIVGWGLGDWFAVVYRDTPESALIAKCRFRYYESAKVWESGDRKSSYSITPTGVTADALCDKFDQVAAMLAKQIRQDMPGRTVKLIARRVRGDAKQFTDEFMKTGFAHTLVVPDAKGPTDLQ
jgi:hypothetical protein